MKEVGINEGNGQKPPPSPPPPPPPPPQSGKIKHLFVLCMENRSFDHMIGYSGISGTDTVTGKPTSIVGLSDEVAYYNDYTYTTEAEIAVVARPATVATAGSAPAAVGEAESKLKAQGPPSPPPPPPHYATARYPVTTSAGDTIYNNHDVKHQFPDVMNQICGQGMGGNAYRGGSPYPAVAADPTKTGFAADYALNSDRGNPGEPMRCFIPENLPVLSALAAEFVVCDHWFSSLPGPTEPNRMFIHAASSGVWDDSPTNDDYIGIFAGKTVGAVVVGSDYGISFENGTIFDSLRRSNVPFRIYAGDGFPQVGLLSGISLFSDIDDFDDFTGDVGDPGYDAAYTFIEPRYDTISEQVGRTFINNSQHPANSVTLGEQLIKTVYEAIRNSPVWDQSMLIILWDEHGGLYDHVIPPKATPTGQKGKKYGFMFDWLGVRVPAVVISPLCPEHGIEHRQFEHANIPATIEQLFGLQPLTIRDTGALGLHTLATLASPRNVTATIPDPISQQQIQKIQPAGPAPGAPVTVSTSSGTSGNSILGSLQTGTTKALFAEAAPAAAPAAQAAPASLAAHGATLASTTSIQQVSLSATTLANSAAPLDLTNSWLSAALAVAAKAHIEAVPADAATIPGRVFGVKTVGDLAAYYDEVTPIISNAKVLARQKRVALRKQTVS
ncbi:MAG TPA: alkaline phosphatase family protein [Caulobacteraceae bacterium]|jgi:phospholipase C